MEEFLKQLKLSELAVKIYLYSLGRIYLSSYELNSIVPNLNQKEYSKAIDELINTGLLIPITAQKSEIIVQYLAIPPFNPIINYIANINANLNSIKNQLFQLLSNSLKKIFKENVILEIDTVFTTTQNLRSDIQEEAIIQKQEVEDIVQGMENLRIAEKALTDLHQTIKGITQNQFATLIKVISNIKNDINRKIEFLELKKYEKDVKRIIEDTFKENLDKLVGDFTENLHKLIQDEFNNTIESLTNIIESTYQFRNDFKMLLLNMLNSFETKMTKIYDSIKNKKEKYSEDLIKFQDIILENLNEIVRNSVDSVAALNNPIDKVMKNYFQVYTAPEKIQINNFWKINSVSRVNEEISNLLVNSNENLYLIIPKLETHLNLEQFKNIARNLKIKIASTEAHTNSTVKKFKEIINIEYRTLKNESIVILKGDNSYIVIGVIQSNTSDPLNNFIGFGSNYDPLIKLINPIINTTWEIASSDLHQAPKSIGISAIPSKESISMKPKPIIPHPIKEKFQKLSQKETTPEKVTDLTQQLQQHVSFISQVHPKAGDEAGILISNAFDSLVQKLGKLRGEKFSQELQKVADLILEKKGFSVTLHKLRSTINQYKFQIDLLNENDRKQIIDSINEWKSHLLK